MPHRIAIHPDKIRHKNGEMQSFSARWAERAAEAGVEVRQVDAFSADVFQQLEGCDGFMWRFGYTPLPRLFAKRLLMAIEHGLGIPVFPSWQSAWHFEDKIAQHYLLQASGIPTPATWVFWNRDAALAFCRRASYPLVMKLAYGFQSANVQLLRSVGEAEHWVRQMFGPGVTGLRARSPVRSALRTARGALRHLQGLAADPHMDACELQHGYFYAQEFLAGNEFDTRITVIGNRAFAFRRFNRPDDFRASGSGRINWDPDHIDLDSVRLACRAAHRLNTQSIAVDVLRKGDTRVLNEISYTYASWVLRECPGHWVLHGAPDAGRLQWVDGKMRPEDAIFDDFLERVRPKVSVAV